MSPRTVRAASPTAHPGLARIAVAAVVGAVGAWGALTFWAPRSGPSGDDARAADRAPATAMRYAGAETRSTAAASATGNAAPATAGPPLDDAALAVLAQDGFGFECPGIAERASTTSTGFEFTCTNGERLRLYALPGAAPRIGPAH